MVSGMRAFRLIARAAPALAALAALLAAGAPAGPARATSIVASAPHDPRRGCAAILHLIANLNAGRLRDENMLFDPTYHNDVFGKVERDEEAAFLHAMRNNEGHADAAPIRLYGVYRVHAERYQATYLVVLERRLWHEIRLEEDGMLDVTEIHDPSPLLRKHPIGWRASSRTASSISARPANSMR